MVNEIDLSSFKLHNGLSGRIWEKGGHLKPEVRLELLDIADDFWNDMGIDWVDVDDIILTGSICNYNWSRMSDIDLHILVSYNEVSENTELVEKLFKSKKLEWCDAHDIQINGFDVEVYVQDTDGVCHSGGVYSLNKDKWVQKPNKGEMKEVDQDDEGINVLCDSVTILYKRLRDYLDMADNDGTYEYIYGTANKVIDKLTSMRKGSLDKYGEMGRGNIAYKALKRTGVVDGLYDLSDNAYDKLHTIG